MIVYDMPMMSKFVADFYQQKVSEIKSLQAKLAASAPGEIQRSSGEGVARHPGDDRSSAKLKPMFFQLFSQGQ